MLSTFFASLRSVLSAQLLDERGGVDAGVPDVEVPHLGELLHLLPVRANGAEHGFASLIVGEVPLAPGDLDARGEALEIPLEWPRQRLVEVVQVEHEVALRRCEAAEVEEVSVARELDDEIGPREPCEVAGHDGCGATEERER
jgi:hypothetical protein